MRMGIFHFIDCYTYTCAKSNDSTLMINFFFILFVSFLHNLQIAQRALESFTELIGRLGQDFNAYTPTVLPHVVDRLGDSRDTVREKAQLVLHKLMESRVLLPQTLLDKLTPCFKHKNAKVREEFLQTIVNTLNEWVIYILLRFFFFSTLNFIEGERKRF